MNSKYWLSQKQKYEKEKKIAENVVSKLDSINLQLLNVPTALRTSEIQFGDGGYYDGDTPDRGVLKICYNEMDDILGEISNVLYESDILIKELKDKVNDCQTNYLNALKEEGGK